MRTMSNFFLIYAVLPLLLPSDTVSTTLEDFGYAFNDAGQLRQFKNNEITDLPFEFKAGSTRSQNEAQFNTLGEIITDHVYQMLLDIGLHKIYLPSPHTENSSFVFGTKTSFKDTKKLLILIHGSGVVRAGQWSRSLIIEQSIEHGTQIPYIKRAMQLGYDVLVTNTNNNYRYENGSEIDLKGHESPQSHIVSVWEQLIAPAFDTIESFAVVAHSYGGVVTLAMAKKSPDAFLQKCFAVAFTDSVHRARVLSSTMLDWFQKNARNYVTSSEPLSTELKHRSNNIPRFSAGHKIHKWTSWAAIDAVFPYLEEKYTQFIINKRSGQLDH